MILTVSLLFCAYLAGCRNKLGNFELCVTLDNPSLFCASQDNPTTAKGYDKKYHAGMICMEPSDFNKIIDEISIRDASLAKYKIKP